MVIYRNTEAKNVKVGDSIVHRTGTLFRVTSIQSLYLGYITIHSVSTEPDGIHSTRECQPDATLPILTA